VKSANLGNHKKEEFGKGVKAQHIIYYGFLAVCMVM
jgi:hypothetical protein